MNLPGRTILSAGCGTLPKRAVITRPLPSGSTAYLPPSARVFDAGGGLGDLAIWLSYHVRHVTLIERDPKAVAAFRERCPQNVSAMMGDVFSYIPDQLYDALVLCSFGKPNEILPLARELTRGKTFVIQSSGGGKRRFP